MSDVMIWTAAEVRKHLPNVRLRVSPGHIVDARVSGRQLPFARVSVTNSKPRRGVPIFMDWEFSWETIADCLNRGSALDI